MTERRHIKRYVNWTAVIMLAVYGTAVLVAITKTAQAYRLLGYYRATPWAAWIEALITSPLVELAPLALGFAAAELFGDDPHGRGWWGKKTLQGAGLGISVGMTFLLNKVLSGHMVGIWDFAALTGEYANLATALSADVINNLLSPAVTKMVRTWRDQQAVAAVAEDARAWERERQRADDELARDLKRKGIQLRHLERMAKIKVSGTASSDRTVDVQPEQELSREDKLAAIVDMYRADAHVSQREIGRQVSISPTTVRDWRNELVTTGRLKMTLDGGFTPNGHGHD